MLSTGHLLRTRAILWRKFRRAYLSFCILARCWIGNIGLLKPRSRLLIRQVKRGHVPEVIELLKEIQAYSETQGVEERIFVEPWGDAARVHIHFDHADMSEAQEDWERMDHENLRAKVALEKLDLLTEPNPRVYLLLER